MNFGFFGPKNGRFVTHNCFSKKGAETPIYSVFGCTLFAKVSKKGNFEKPPKNGKFCLITEKLFFGIFAVFWGFFFFLFFVVLVP